MRSKIIIRTPDSKIFCEPLGEDPCKWLDVRKGYCEQFQTILRKKLQAHPMAPISLYAKSIKCKDICEGNKI